MGSSQHAEEFVALLTEKFKDADRFSCNKFSVMPGRKFDRIVQETQEGSNRHVHAFVERETGGVYKAAGWPAPAKGERFMDVRKAAHFADLFGSYLYARR